MRLIVTYAAHVEPDGSNYRGATFEFDSMDDIYVRNATLIVNQRNSDGKINRTRNFPLSSLKKYDIEPSEHEESLED